jgi:hypothetical protein
MPDEYDDGAWVQAHVDAAMGGALTDAEARIRRLAPPEGADLPTWHALHQTVLTIFKGEGAPFCSPQRKAAGWRCAAPCADAECVPEDGGTAVMGDGLADAVSVAVLALADDWDDFDHDPATCPRYDCGNCTMKNAVYDLRTCVESVTGVRRGGHPMTTDPLRNEHAAAAVAQERERIAQALEAEMMRPRSSVEGPFTMPQVYRLAARIARSGGTDG